MHFGFGSITRTRETIWIWFTVWMTATSRKRWNAWMTSCGITVLETSGITIRACWIFCPT
jgi:hypothetical protein